MKSRSALLITAGAFILLMSYQVEQRNDLISYVDPFIGTDGHGHTFPGATVPFGMVQLSPDTRKDSWDGCSGYHYSDNTIHGFSHKHLSGTGACDYGDVRLMPMTDTLRIYPGPDGQHEEGYRSRFSHETEKAHPGYYKVELLDYKIDVELTSTARCGFHRYTFPASDESYILIDLAEGVTSDKILDSEIKITGDDEIAGFRRTQGWANDHYEYFVAKFSKPFLSKGIIQKDKIVNDSISIRGIDLKAFAMYSTQQDEEILVKVGISAVDLEGARKNLEAEIPGWDFELTVDQAAAEWRKELSKIMVKGGSIAERRAFYTALYHAFIAPNIYSDVDGRYRGNDLKVHNSPGHSIYTVFSLWDTYRAEHPLFTLIQPDRNTDFIRTFLDIYKKRGLLPVWELSGCETYCMIGYHSVPVIVDAYMKGHQDFDVQLAMEAMKYSSNQDHFGLRSYRTYGYIPAEDEGESVSKTLEYAYDDWCIAMMAKSLGNDSDYVDYISRAQSYKNLFDPQTNFLRGKRNGMFAEPFDPVEVNTMLTEANTWQYTFYVPQDISGLAALMGGEDAFEKKLDDMFNATTLLTGRNQADITGLIGQYAHGNEPSHHMAYLYNYIGKPEKTQKMVRRIMKEMYTDQPDGLCGNEDCGQMSAWYVMSAIGIYPVTPGSNQYIIGSPLFDEVTIDVGDGRTFTVVARNNSSENIYISSSTLNGKAFHYTYLNHEEIMKGGILSFFMSPDSKSDWGREREDRPISAINEHLITPVPYFKASNATFSNTIGVEIHSIDHSMVKYGMSELQLMNDPLSYSNPLTLTETTSVYAIAENTLGVKSRLSKSNYYKLPHDYKINIVNPYNPQYTGGGDMALVDMQTGTENFRTGHWQGYHGVDLDVIIDLGTDKFIKDIYTRFLDDQGAWIFLPQKVQFSLSHSPGDYQVVYELEIPEERSSHTNIVTIGKSDINEKGRYIRIYAKNTGVCPSWHPGAGDKAWIFIDEVIIK